MNIQNVRGRSRLLPVVRSAARLLRLRKGCAIFIEVSAVNYPRLLHVVQCLSSCLTSFIFTYVRPDEPDAGEIGLFGRGRPPDLIALPLHHHGGDRLWRASAHLSLEDLRCPFWLRVGEYLLHLCSCGSTACPESAVLLGDPSRVEIGLARASERCILLHPAQLLRVFCFLLRV